MSDCVYVILTNNGDVKVGLSGTPYARLSKVKREYGVRRGFTDAYLVGFVVTEYGLFVESYAHSHLEKFAAGGEWYRVNPLIALGIVSEGAKVLEEDALLYAIGPEEPKMSVKDIHRLLMKRVGVSNSPRRAQ